MNPFRFSDGILNIVVQQKSGQGDEAADSTSSTKPIHLVLQHLRESFSLS
ncbi:TPA: hypothetical protein WIX37_000866 [Neisseria meningitidis]|nr:hypothetical protein [Neisseria meningitidis]MCL5904055.1 hypothetical protein [Neisseria meningitidis]MCL6117786.1 hypothetical protein [Neisseria meningitidis]